MGYAQKLILLLGLLGCNPARGYWLATIGTKGFFGDQSVGGIYFSQHHELELSLGTYSRGGGDSTQANAAYRYSKWVLPFLGDTIWHPIQVGLFSTYSLDRKHYFLESPAKYPYEDYYDQTAFRWGIDLGSNIFWSAVQVSLAYHIRVLDTGVIAIYNNSHKDLQYYISSGLSLRYHF